MSSVPRPTHILAAGGLLRRDTASGPLLAVVHRHRHGDHSLPKGKVDPGEALQAAALREVLEETGCTGRIVGPPDFCEYAVQGVPKIVVLFPMQCDHIGEVVDTGEVAELLWLSPQEAIARLTHPLERAIVQRAFPER